MAETKNVNAVIVATIANHLNCEAADVDPLAMLVALGADSLDRAEIGMTLEDRFDILFDGDDEANWETVGDVMDDVKALIAKKAHAGHDGEIEF